MAGGKLAADVACLPCLFDHGRLTRARRIQEGRESDQYLCDEGHQFGIDWSKGPATEPQWPAPQELRDLVKK
ncbi:MAG TPA: hypothetical protein VGK67_29000 [Myxococcales bacterium]|jgi:hypothetical protein